MAASETMSGFKIGQHRVLSKCCTTYSSVVQHIGLVPALETGKTTEAMDTEGSLTMRRTSRKCSLRSDTRTGRAENGPRLSRCFVIEILVRGSAGAIIST